MRALPWISSFRGRASRLGSDQCDARGVPAGFSGACWWPQGLTQAPDGRSRHSTCATVAGLPRSWYSPARPGAGLGQAEHMQRPEVSRRMPSSGSACSVRASSALVRAVAEVESTHPARWVPVVPDRPPLTQGHRGLLTFPPRRIRDITPPPNAGPLLTGAIKKRPVATRRDRCATARRSRRVYTGRRKSAPVTGADAHGGTHPGGASRAGRWRGGVRRRPGRGSACWFPGGWPVLPTVVGWHGAALRCSRLGVSAPRRPWATGAFAGRVRGVSCAGAESGLVPTTGGGAGFRCPGWSASRSEAPHNGRACAVDRLPCPLRVGLGQRHGAGSGSGTRSQGVRQPLAGPHNGRAPAGGVRAWCRVGA